MDKMQPPKKKARPYDQMINDSMALLEQTFLFQKYLETFRDKKPNAAIPTPNSGAKVRLEPI